MREWSPFNDIQTKGKMYENSRNPMQHLSYNMANKNDSFCKHTQLKLIQNFERYQELSGKPKGGTSDNNDWIERIKNVDLMKERLQIMSRNSAEYKCKQVKNWLNAKHAKNKTAECRCCNLA